MGKLKPLGVVGGLVGNALIGVAIYELLQTGSCGDVGQPACSDEILPFVLMLPVGILLSVVSIVLGGGAFIFAGVFLAVGLGAMASSGFGNNEETRTFGWMFGAAFTLFGLLPLVGMLALRPLARRRLATAERLVATGGRGVGTVTSVRDTGVTVNEDPREEITMRVEPVDGSPPFDRSKTVTVSRVAIPRPGDRFPVWYDRDDPGTWAYGTDMEASASLEVRELFERATRPHVAFNAPVPGAAPGRPSPLDELAKLNELRMSGALTDEEFSRAKDRLLGGGSSNGVSA